MLPGLARGDFEPLRSWLRANVHAKASLLESDDLLRAATGRPLEASVFQDHLRTRYIEGGGESGRARRSGQTAFSE